MIIQLRSRAPAAQVDALIGTQAKPAHAAVWLTQNADVYKPDGQPLLFLRKAAISPAAYEGARPFFETQRQAKSENRGAYTGGRVRRALREDGSLSNTTRAYTSDGKIAYARSSVAGAMDRYPRIPFCRQSAVTLSDPHNWQACFPFIQEAAHVLQQAVPARYAAQLAVAKQTHPAYVIPGTPFTTVTINNTYAGSYHRDKGDYAKGFGCMAVFRRGAYAGCELVIPAYGIGVDLQDRDVVLFDVHELHGNTAFRDAVGEPIVDHERVSVVLYYRERMADCLAPEQELLRAKAVRGRIDDDAPADGAA